MPLADGSFLALTRRFQSQLNRLRGISEDHAQGLRLPMLGALAMQDITEEAGAVKADKEWKAFVARLNAAESRQPRPPSTLQADLRDYQLEGFQWLSRLAHWQAGACLADDMGLGKTVQAIAAMLEQAPHGPCLVIAPTSVCHNWENELSRFAPSLVPQKLGAAAGRAEIFTGLKAMDVLVISYGLLHQEADRLAEIDWRMVVFDEAQAVKNAETRRAQAGQRLKAHFRLALTGTPIENYLDELWSLFNIVNPGLLGSRERFSRRFATPIERNRDANALQALRALIRPFILRRTKSAVLAELPSRTEVTLEIDLPEDERAFYEAMRLRALEALAQLRDGGGKPGQNRIHLLAEITRLRRACCHPGADRSRNRPARLKLEAFLELVEDLIRNRHKVLVFSQFVGQLERVAEVLRGRKISFQYLDGSTPAPERAAARRSLPGRRGRPVPDQPEGGRLRPQPHRRRLRDPSRSLVESRRRGSGQRPRPPHRPDPPGDHLSPDRARLDRGKDFGVAPLQARSRQRSAGRRRNERPPHRRGFVEPDPGMKSSWVGFMAARQPSWAGACHGDINDNAITQVFAVLS